MNKCDHLPLRRTAVGGCGDGSSQTAFFPSIGSLENGLEGHFEAWQNPPIFKDVGAVNAGKITDMNTTCTATGMTAGLQLKDANYSNIIKATVTKIGGCLKSR